MPNFVKNAMNQIMFPMVDRTDFASIESGITASDFNSAATKKIFGVNHGVSDAFTSATISKATTLVRSGIFQQTLKASECNYDYLIVSFRHPSCADQILIYQPQEIDPSDVYSMLSDLRSDFQSRVPKAVATNSQLSDLHSDLLSYLTGMSGMQSDIYSNLSDLKSDFQSRVPKLVATFSQLSDVHSDLQSRIGGITVTISASDVSDIASAVVAGLTGLTQSDISNIASAVRDILVSDLSDILSAAQQGNSRILVVQSRVSDVESALDSQFSYESNALSDLRSLIVDASSIESNIYSLLSDLQSDFQSRVPKRVATDSQLSDVNSDLRSLIGAGVVVTISSISDIVSAIEVQIGSRLSDILSAAQQTNSRVLVTQSHASNIYSLLSDVQSDLLSHLDTTGVQLNGSVMSDIRSMIGGVTVTLSASDISDIASAVVAGGTGLTVSNISDIASAVVAALVGGGAKQVVLTVEDNLIPLDGVDVWVTTDITGLSIVARGYTDALGKVVFYLDPGTYYAWKSLSGFTFTNPEAFTVT